MKIIICGLAITSSWGNGHATTYRSLARALHAHGHEIVFFERDLEWYASNRDMPEPPFCRVFLYEHWREILPSLRRELGDADVAMVGSYFPDGIEAIACVLDSGVAIKAFYDIDTPITVGKLKRGDAEYLRRDQIREFDLYFSFTGGPMLEELMTNFHARRAVPLYCSFDPDRYRLSAAEARFHCDLSYMGTYAADRQAKLEELLCRPARQLAELRFLVAGPQYPESITWPANVGRITHLEPKFHPPFYCSSRMTLNLTRREMVETGYSPSVRLFEAAGCGATIITDTWPGLDTLFVPQREILLADTGDQVIRYLRDINPDDARAIGRAAQERVMAQHTAEKRAAEFENYVGAKTFAKQCA